MVVKRLKSDVIDVLRKLVSQVASRLIDVQKWAEREGFARNDVARSACKRFADIIGTLMGIYKDGGIGEVGASSMHGLDHEEE